MEVMTIKKLLYLIIIVAMVLSLSACGSGDDSLDSSPTVNTPGSGSNGTSSPSNSPDSGDGGEDGPLSSETPDPGDSGETTSPENGGSDIESSPSASPSPEENGEADSNASEDLVDTLANLVDEFINAGATMPISMPAASVSAEDSQYAIGLSSADFGQYVVAASQSIAGLTTNAHQIVLIQGVDSNAASQIKRLVSSNGGYDPTKWICVFPETAIVVDSGPYVLLVASFRDVADIAVAVFEETFGSIGEIVTFWDGVV